jgi:uncharacterized membrane protein YjfL (UPF0719 family)
VTGFDFVVLAILAVSGVLGLVRGLLKEVLSLVAYLLAFVAAIWWGPTVYAWLEPYIETTLLRMGVSYAAVFIIVLLGVGLVNMTLAALIRSTGLSPADHGLGGVFGLARGLHAAAGRAVVEGRHVFAFGHRGHQTYQDVAAAVPGDVAAVLICFKSTRKSHHVWNRRGHRARAGQPAAL